MFLKIFMAFYCVPSPPSVLVVWTVFLTVSQIIICKLLFVAKESSAMKTLIIDNKSVIDIVLHGIIAIFKMFIGGHFVSFLMSCSCIILLLV